MAMKSLIESCDMAKKSFWSMQHGPCCMDHAKYPPPEVSQNDCTVFCNLQTVRSPPIKFKSCIIRNIFMWKISQVFLICSTIWFLMADWTRTELNQWRHFNDFKVLWISNIVLTYLRIRLTWDFYYPEVRKAKMYFQNLKII